MREIHGLKQLYDSQQNALPIDKLAELLMDDLANCHCVIYGENQQQILAKLDLVPDSLFYERFDKRIDLSVAGQITSNEHPPLTYCLQGKNFSISGRCSVLPQVCGVDLYLSHYDENDGFARQNFSVPLKKLPKE
ncbi:MAG: hypothetical protein GQ569_03985 [Methylococcaceae bacterium]|nr:hypothetical protein [Methylococcaceae bacterium]